MRLDAEIVSRGILPSRERAKEKIKNKDILVNGKICVKPSAEVTDTDVIEFTGEKLKYVGRGGLKLERAVDFFGIDLKGLVCLDVGASSGGFTDCMLQRGAGLVYAVEVGHGQLAEKLLSDSRVVSMERTDIRNLDEKAFEKQPEFVCADVSFISLKLIIPYIYRLVSDNCECVFLIKPQFEAGRSNIGKNGIVKSSKVHVNVINDIINFCTEIGFCIKGLCPSPVKGGSGNIEYLLYVAKGSGESCICDVKETVKTAMQE